MQYKKYKGILAYSGRPEMQIRQKQQQRENRDVENLLVTKQCDILNVGFDYCIEKNKAKKPHRSIHDISSKKRKP